MKKLFLLILSFIMLLSMVSVANENETISQTEMKVPALTEEPDGKLGENIFPNGGFEDTALTAPVYGKYNSEHKHTGDYSLQTRADWNFGGLYMLELPKDKIKLSQKYYYSAWVKIDPAIINTQHIFVFYEFWFDDGKQKQLQINDRKINTSEGFVNISGFFDVPYASGNLDYSKPSGLSIVSYDSGTVYYLDDLYVAEYVEPDEDFDIISSYPKEGGINVSLTPCISVEFSLAIDKNTFTKDSVLVNGQSGMTESVKLFDKGAEIALKHLNPLTNYMVEIVNVASFTGKPISANKISFKTGYENINLCKNGDFENSCLSLPAGASEYHEAQKHNGKYSLKAISYNRFGGLYEMHTPQMQSGKKYYYSVWVKIDDAIKNAQDVCMFYAMKYEGNETKQEEVAREKINSENGFVQISGYFDTPKGNLNSASIPQIMIVIDSSEIITYYVDDFEIYEVPQEFGLSTLSEVAPNAEAEVVGNKLNVLFNWTLSQKDSILPKDILINNSDDLIDSVKMVGNREIEIVLKQPLMYDKKYKIAFKYLQDELKRPAPEFTFKTTQKCRIENIKFYKNYGQPNQSEISRVEQGAISIVANIQNHSEDMAKAVGVIILYKNGVLDKIACKSVQLENCGDKIELNAEINAPQIDDGVYEIKAYFIDGFYDLQALVEENLTLKEVEA